MHRIISLIASSTEIICALGCRNQMVGRSHECDYPEPVKKLPVCTEVKFGTHGTSYEIDQRVKAIIQEGLSVYRVKGEMLRNLKPDVIVTQTQCEVCAVSLKDVEEAICDFTDVPAQVISLHPNALVDVWKDIRQVAKGLDVVERGENLIAELQQRIGDIEKRVQDTHEKPTVACIEWIDPLMAAGNWMPELVELAGGINLFGQAGKHSPWMTWEALCQKNPDILILLPCGFDIPRTLKEMPLLAQRTEWQELQAVKKGRVIVADGNQYFNRPGPRIVESLEIMAEVLYPDLFSFGHEGTGWKYFRDF